jgi:hypothetical protein
MHWTLGKRQLLELSVPHGLQTADSMLASKSELDLGRVHSPTTSLNAASERAVLKRVPKRMVGQ